MTVERAPDPAPELPPAEPDPQSPPPASAPIAPAVPVPPALLDHAQKIADAHHAQTGAPIDTATLRSRLGIPPALADAIATQLN